MELAFECRNTPVLPEWRGLVEDRLAGVAGGHDDIMHARVTVTKNSHHLRGHDEVTMVLTMPGDVLAVTRTGDDVEDAPFQAFQVMEREVKLYRKQHYRTAKPPGPRALGAVVTWFPDRGYGFVRTEGDREVYFHEHAVARVDRPNIALGAQVELDVSRLTIRR